MKAVIHFDKVGQPPHPPNRWQADEGDIWEVNWLGSRIRWIARMSPKEARVVVELWNNRMDRYIVLT